MPHATPRQCIAFEGARRIAAGPLADVALRVKRATERGARGPILVFDAESSEPVEFDVRGSEQDVLQRLERPEPRSPGRPRLGVIAREVTLLPRHWEWLAGQPGGASVTLRRLVDQARHASAEADRVRQAQEAAYRFIHAIAGDRPHFEEASRALFAGDRARFNRLVEHWPADIRAHARALMERARHA
jgi:hypothetical protein